MSEQVIQPLPLNNFSFNDAAFVGVVFSNGSAVAKKYYVSLAKSIARILTTRIGERVMLPEFGSNLYLLRDRNFSGEWRILATRYIYDALRQWEPRVKFKQLHFSIDAITGKHEFSLELSPNV